MSNGNAQRSDEFNRATRESHEPLAAEQRRLVGFLVSYAMNEKGAAFEIRSGRSLISLQPIGEQRTIRVEARDVSTPHAAVKANVKHRVQIQDIFSEHGTFIRRAGQNNETRVDGPVEVNHGDWLRFGSNTRFQVCLIDGPNR